MQTIRYIFADGTASEIEVTDEFYTLYAEPVQQEKRNHWKEKRRHILSDYPNENEIDFASPAADLLSVLMQRKDENRTYCAVRVVGRAKAACQAVFCDGKSKIARDEKVGEGKMCGKVDIRGDIWYNYVK